MDFGGIQNELKFSKGIFLIIKVLFVNGVPKKTSYKKEYTTKIFLPSLVAVVGEVKPVGKVSIRLAEAQ